MTTQAFERKLRGYIATASGLPPENVIPGNEKGPSPRNSYATVLLVDDPAMAYNVEIPDGTTINNVSNRRATYSVQFFRKGAVDYARTFCIYAETEQGLTDQRDAGFFFQAPLDYSRLDDIVGDGYEERAVVELELNYAVTTSQTVVTIDSMDYRIDYGGIIEEGQHGP